MQNVAKSNNIPIGIKYFEIPALIDTQTQKHSSFLDWNVEMSDKACLSDKFESYNID